MSVENPVAGAALPRRFIGMDFSGAARAGNHIWICEARRASDGLEVCELLQARELPGSAPAREPCFAVLPGWVAEQGDAAFGMDFPFSLPEAMLGEETWEQWALQLGARHPDPDHFRAACRAVSSRPELKRRSDRESEAPFSPYNLWIYRQTYYGVRDLLAPLVGAGVGCVLPMQRRLEHTPWILETCPASILKRLSLYAPYKGRGKRERHQRRRILEAVERGRGLRFADRTMPTRILADPHGDALDSLLTAVIVAGTLADPEPLRRPPGPPYDREGIVFC